MTASAGIAEAVRRFTPRAGLGGGTTRSRPRQPVTLSRQGPPDLGQGRRASLAQPRDRYLEAITADAAMAAPGSFRQGAPLRPNRLRPRDHRGPDQGGHL